jgi:hypothetical protein
LINQTRTIPLNIPVSLWRLADTVASHCKRRGGAFFTNTFNSGEQQGVGNGLLFKKGR